MTNRLNTLLTTLRKLGNHYTNEDVNTKILRVLPKKDWESRVTSSEESHDLSKLSTDILIDKLLTHELTIKQREEEKEEKEERKKGIALKAIQGDSDEENSNSSSEEDDELAMLTRGFKKFLRKKKVLKAKGLQEE